jgi:peptidyl-prolyl cis-trans isomerase C
MNVTRTYQILTLAIAGSIAMAGGVAEAADAAAKVNGVAIPQSKVDLLVKNATAQGQPDSPELRQRIRDELVTRELLGQEAVKKGLDKSPEIATQIELARQSLLVNAYLQEYFKTNPITDDMMKKEYEAAKTQTGGKEYKARHILVKQEDEAKQIIAQLKKGASFEKLAAEKSEDTGSKGKGGDLDWSPPNRYVKPFHDALLKLKKGQMTDTPVQSPFGWHVIRLDDERPFKAPGFDEVKASIHQQLQNQAVQKAIGDLRAKAKIE